MNVSDSSQRVSLWPWVYLIAAVYFTLHLATSTRYGYFRDALYYLACSEHLALGYVDQPPLIAWLGWFTRHTLGTSLPALLFWPALAGAARIVQRSFRTRTRRTTFRHRARRDTRSDARRLVGDRSSAWDELLRASLMGRPGVCDIEPSVDWGRSRFRTQFTS